MIKKRAGLLLAGLAEREAVAVQMMVQGAWPKSALVILPRREDFVMPPQDEAASACTGVVLNLLGLGLLRHGAQAQEKLLAFLAGRSAVLLLHSGDSTWAAAQLPREPGQKLVLLTPPCASAVLRQAILDAGIEPGIEGRADMAEKNPKTATAEAAETVLAMGRPAGGSAATARSAVATRSGYSHMGNGALEQLEQALPALQDCDWMRLVRKSLQAQGRSRFEIGPTSFVLDMRAGWLASALPTSAMQKMWQTPQMMSSLRMQALAPDQLQPIAQRDFGTRLGKAQKPLDMVVWEMSCEALKPLALRLEHDLLLRLRRYPNFTQLGGGNALDMQLATLCATAPRSLRQLQGLFAHAEQEVLRFAAQSVLAGLVVVAPASASGAGALRPVVHTPEAVAKRGFFKAFLSKLF